MATRRYEQRRRIETAEQTRRRILDAVLAEVRESPGTPVRVDAVARRADVARSTVYVVFGSRDGLLDAVIDDLWHRSGLPELTAAVAHDDAREHLRGGIRAANAMYAAERDVYRMLFSTAQLYPDSVGAAIARKERNRAGGMTHLARRLADQDVLRDDVSVRAAADVLWMLCSFETFDVLYAGRGMSLARTNRTIIDTAERALYREPTTDHSQMRRG